MFASGAFRLPALRKLSLPGNIPYDAPFFSFTIWKQVEELGISHTGIGPEGFAALAAGGVSRLPALRTLELQSNDLEDAGFLALMQGTWLRLEALKLGYNTLTP